MTMLNIRKFLFNPFQETTLLLWDDTQEGVIVDPGCMDPEEKESLTAYIAKEQVRPVAIWLTHGHFDHIYGVPDLAGAYGIPVFMHPDDAVMVANNWQLTRRYRLPDAPKDFPFEPLQDGQELRFGHTVFTVITTPGHTPGGVCFLDAADKVLVSGDTLFAGSIGRTDSEWGDYDKLIVSIMDKLMGLDGDIDVIPGHGPVTNIGHERTHNPFLQPFNEPEEEMDWDADGISLDGDYI